MTDTDTLIEAIASNSDCVELAPLGEGTDPQWVQEAQNILGVKFTPEYAWFLVNYGGGEIGGEEIISLYGPDYESAGPGDLINYNIGSELFMHESKLVICDNGSELFYFDCSILDDNTVHRMDYTEQTDEVYTENFTLFLIKRIGHLCE